MVSQIEKLQKPATPGDDDQNDPGDPLDGGGDAYADDDQDSVTNRMVSNAYSGFLC